VSYCLAVDTEIVSADGTVLAVRRTGHGVPVVMVHGSAGGLDSWTAIAGLLRDEFEVWSYARRGYAPSGEVSRRKTFTDDVADLAAVAGAANGVPHLVGASYGATVVLHAVREIAERFRSAVIFEPPLFAAGPALIPVLDEYRYLVSSRRFGASARLFAARVAQAPASLLGPDIEPGLPEDSAESALQAAEATGCLHDLEAMTADGTDLARWAAVGIPLLVMQDELTWAPMPATVDALMDVLPPAAMRAVLKDQSHFASHTVPELFTSTVRGFLREQSA
jgi:pimeloyl-ACP methyl ester carboxylesterase